MCEAGTLEMPISLTEMAWPVPRYLLHGENDVHRSRQNIRTSSIGRKVFSTHLPLFATRYGVLIIFQRPWAWPRFDTRTRPLALDLNPNRVETD